jgi:hypothetical protein
MNCASSVRLFTTRAWLSGNGSSTGNTSSTA